MSSQSFIALNKSASPKRRLFLFAHAGSGASSFSNWKDKFSDDIEVFAVIYPGREARILEPAYDSIEPLATSLADQIKPLFEVPCSFFGHSMGAKVAFETAYILEANSYPLSHVFLSASRAPHIAQKRVIYHLPQQQFLEELIDIGGTSREFLENQELLDLFLPTLRKDFTLTDTYTRENNVFLNSPITIMASREDREVDPDDVKEWSGYAKNEWDFHLFNGDHFFPIAHADLVTELINEKLCK